MEKTIKTTAMKLPFLTKISYGCVGAANMMTSVITNTYLIFFYTNGLGLSGPLAGTLSLAGSAWGWFCTAAGGAVIDRTSSKKGGKCRNYIIKFIFPAAVLLVLSFLIPDLSNGLTAAWVLIMYCLRTAVWTLVQLPATTLMGRITDDKVQRSHLNQIYTMMSTAGSMISVAVTMPFINRFGSDAAGVKKGFIIISVIYAVLFACLYLLAYIGTKGYEPEKEFFEAKGSDTQAKKPTVVQIFKGLIANKMCLIAVVLYLVDLTGCMVESSAMPYYYQYNMAGFDMLKLYSMNSTISIAGSFAAYFVVGFFVKRLGNSGTAAMGSIIAASVYIIRFITKDVNLYGYLACLAVGVFGAGLVACVSIQCVFDAKIYGEWKLGINAEGILMAAYSLGNTLGLAIGRAGAGFLMGLIPDFDQTAAAQPENVLNLFRIESTLIPCAGFLLALGMAFILMKFEKQLPKWQAELEARKSAAAR